MISIIYGVQFRGISSLHPHLLTAFIPAITDVWTFLATGDQGYTDRRSRMISPAITDEIGSLDIAREQGGTSENPFALTIYKESDDFDLLAKKPAIRDVLTGDYGCFKYLSTSKSIKPAITDVFTGYYRCFEPAITDAAYRRSKMLTARKARAGATFSASNTRARFNASLLTF